MTESARFAGHDWIPVKKQKAITIEGVNYVQEDHHVEETSYLIDTVRKLATRMDSLQEEKKQGEEKQQKKEGENDEGPTTKKSETAVYKIFRKAEFDSFIQAGHTSGAPVDLADGFVHFSTRSQVEETARRYFAGVADLMLLAVSVAECGKDLKWELSPSRGEDFPHLYRDLRVKDMMWARPFSGQAPPEEP